MKTYKGLTTKLYNRRITLVKLESGDYILQFRNVDDMSPDEPSVRHEVLKGKVRQSTIRISEEGLRTIGLLFNKIKKRG